MKDNQSKHFDEAHLLRQQFAQYPDGAFEQALSAEQICSVVEQHCLATVRQRQYPPLKTLRLFVGQALGSDGSCQNVVVRQLAQRLSAGLSAASTNTAAYCQARMRLPTAIACDLSATLAAQLEAMSPKVWRWQGRSVKLFDGTSMSMPDTASNQAAYPQSRTQAPGLGFPMVRIGALIGLASGAVLGYELTPLRGKGSGEQTALRGLLDKVMPGDIVLADALLATWWLIHAISARGADVLMAQHGRRKSDFTQGQSLGKNDHLVQWPRPAKPQWMSEQEYAQCPAVLHMRESQVNGRVLVSTMRQPNYASAKALDQLYAMRWNIEVDFRVIKATLGMDVLRCKSSQMIDKEIAVGILAYNLVRWAMAASAVLAQVLARSLSFSAAKRLLGHFGAALLRGKSQDEAALVQALLQNIGKLHLRARPGRIEPRAKKRRPKNLPLLRQPRQQAREAIQSKRGLIFVP